ncbi:protein kinase domain-containing protein [Nocardia yamanashiensis]|uniref:protein kinase domain-containing protein n=1 Tax=Nocardia yamanashiensis TaxID=209247 RepID=UPI0008337AEA|nr:protein kinase [Nocardia yamanashiensis]
MNEYPAQAVCRFTAEWESTLRGERDEPPGLRRFLPDGQLARLAVLTELVRIDVRQRRRRAGMEKRIIDYRSEFPEVTGSPEYADLVFDEYLARNRRRPLDIDTFVVEYPEVAGEIRARSAGLPEPPVRPALPADIGTGRRLDDFDLLTELGGTDHSRMFLARQRSMQRLVAVRVEAGADTDTPTVAQLEHQHIVRVYDQRLIADGSSGKPLRLLYMQYHPGGTVAGVLAQLRGARVAESVTAETGSGLAGHPGQVVGRAERTVLAARVGRNHNGPRLTGSVLLAAVDAAMEARGEIRSAASSRIRAEIAELTWPETVAWVGRRLAEALEYAQRHGVLHHDIRPGNVIFTAEGVPKLADFSVGPLYPPEDLAELEQQRYRSPEALAALDPRAALDDGYGVVGVGPGTPVVAAPDARSDIYSLGLLLWEMLTGAMPFDPPAEVEATPPAEHATTGPVDRPDREHMPTTGPARLPGRGDPYEDGIDGAATTGSDPTADGAGSHAAAPGNGSSLGARGDSEVRRLLRQRRIGVSAAAIAALPADTPATLRRVLTTCLEPDPDRRWQNGAELAGQLDLCLDARARDLVDPPPRSVWARLRRWPVPIAALCVGLPNLLASVYNIRLNQSLIVDRLPAADQERFGTVALVNNAIAFPLAALVLLWLARRPLAVTYRLARGHRYTPAELARARRDTLLMGERAVWVPFAMWIFAGVAWPLGLSRMGAQLSAQAYAHFFAAQAVCAAIALAYPFFLIAVFSVRSLYPQLLARGAVGPEDRRQLWGLARRANFYLAVAASVPLLGVASATFVSRADLELVIVTVRWLSVGGILAFVISFLLFQRLEADLNALVRAIPRPIRQA